ncbi:MAG: hypothetical protein V9H26_19600 [Verrucomicrobiota bacterium]
MLKALAGTPAIGNAIVRGNPAPIWSLAVLPDRLRTELQAQAAETQETVAQYVDGLVKLAAHGLTPWQPPIPLAEIAADCLADATKLRTALLPTLQRPESNPLSAAERERLALADYQRAFGHPITARHWRRLIERTLQRAGSAREFQPLELYLSDHPKPKASAARLLPHETGLTDLRETIAAFADPAAPSAMEKALLWSQAFELVAGAQSKAGRKALRRELVQFLNRHAPTLAENAHALRVNFERKFSRWQEHGETPAALLDGREARRGVPAADPIPHGRR